MRKAKMPLKVVGLGPLRLPWERRRWRKAWDESRRSSGSRATITGGTSSMDRTDEDRPTIRPEARRIAAVLGRRGLEEGRYYEEPSALEWLALEASDVYDAIAEGRDPAEVLIDTGYWAPEDEGPFPAELRAALIGAA